MAAEKLNAEGWKVGMGFRDPLGLNKLGRNLSTKGTASAVP